jgi:hypothetical protein
MHDVPRHRPSGLSAVAGKGNRCSGLAGRWNVSQRPYPVTTQLPSGCFTNITLPVPLALSFPDSAFAARLKSTCHPNAACAIVSDDKIILTQLFSKPKLLHASKPIFSHRPVTGFPAAVSSWATPVQQLLSLEAPPFPLSSRPERSVVERSAVRPSAFSNPASEAIPDEPSPQSSAYPAT